MKAFCSYWRLEFMCSFCDVLERIPTRKKYNTLQLSLRDACTTRIKRSFCSIDNSLSPLISVKSSVGLYDDCVLLLQCSSSWKIRILNIVTVVKQMDFCIPLRIEKRIYWCCLRLSVSFAGDEDFWNTRLNIVMQISKVILNSGLNGFWFATLHHFASFSSINGLYQSTIP